MAVGTYTLPICDGCKLPWLPVGWTQDSDPRHLREGAKPLRCGKCKSIGWDRDFVKQQKADATETVVSPFDRAKTIEMPRNVALNEALERGVAQMEEQRISNSFVAGSSPAAPSKVDGVEMPIKVVANEALQSVEDEIVAAIRKVSPARCKHRMTDCPICHPKEAA